jgi:urease accessory protein
MKNNALVRLLHLTDSTLPIGGFTHSMGLETYVQKGLVHDIHSAEEFIVQMLTENLQYNDASFLSLAYDAADNFAELTRLDEECSAYKIARETKEASRKLGTRLVRLLEDEFHTEASRQFILQVNKKHTDANYCIVFGMFSAVREIDKKDALTGFFYNQAVSMVTNAVKLVPLGQTEGQKLLFRLHDLIDDLAQRTINPDPELIGKSCPGFDLRCMQHETLYTRLYIS